MILQSTPWSQEGGRARRTRSLSNWPLQASKSLFLLQVFLWTVRLTSDFLLSSEKKNYIYIYIAASKKSWCVLISSLPSRYYPSLTLCCAGFSKSCRNRWPWLCTVERRMERDWITGLTGAGEQEEPTRKLAPPALPKYHKSSRVLGNITFTKPLSDYTKF